MKWITRERPKIDRLACPWLIKNFVDTDAEFIYLPFNQVIEKAKELNAIPFDIPEVEFTHYDDRCTSNYDEHGGFFDHVPPPAIGYKIKGDSNTAFESLGVRIPAILISPYVPKGSVTHLQFDHTSVLQLLAEKFTPGLPYSATVESRKEAGIQSLSEALSELPDLAAPSPPSIPIMVKTVLGDNVSTEPDGSMAQAF